VLVTGVRFGKGEEDLLAASDFRNVARNALFKLAHGRARTLGRAGHHNTIVGHPCVEVGCPICQ